MAEFVNVQIQDGEVLLFNPACSCAGVLDFLSKDPRGGIGTLTDTNNIAVLPEDTLTLDKEPYVFRKFPAARQPAGGGLADVKEGDELRVMWRPPPRHQDLMAAMDLMKQDLQTQQRQMLTEFVSERLFTAVSSQMIGQNILRESVVVSDLPNSLAPLPEELSTKVQDSIVAAVVELKAAKGEPDVQKACGRLFEALQEELPGDCIVRDTSAADYLKNPTAKVDFIFTAGGQVLWTTVVWVLEAKIRLGAKDMYEDALGQIADRTQKLFLQQPHRSHCLAVVLGCDSMELISIPNPRTSPSARITRTGVQPLYSSHVSSGQPPEVSPGMEILLRLFSSSAREHLRYICPEAPASLSFTDGGGTQQALSNFQPLQLRVSSLSPRSTSVYSAELDDGQRVVVKFSESIMDEVSVLRILEGLSPRPHTPRVIGSGVHPKLGAFMVTTPLGRHLGSSDPPDTVIQVVLDVARTIVQTASSRRQAGGVWVLHRDVSAGNVMEDGEGRGLLIDHQVASMDRDDKSSSSMTGTPLFMALSVALFKAPHSVSSDLESLFYNLVYIASDGVVPPGQEAVPFSWSVSAKLAAMLSPELFKSQVVDKCCEELRPLVIDLHRLFVKSSAQSCTYRMEIDPMEFTATCTLHLTNLQTKATSARRRSAPATTACIQAPHAVSIGTPGRPVRLVYPRPSSSLDGGRRCKGAFAQRRPPHQTHRPPLTPGRVERTTRLLYSGAMLMGLF